MMQIFKNFVKINGQVKNPGIYPFFEGMKVEDLLNATMSLADKDFQQTLNLSKITVLEKTQKMKILLLLRQV